MTNSPEPGSPAAAPRWEVEVMDDGHRILRYRQARIVLDWDDPDLGNESHLQFLLYNLNRIQGYADAERDALQQQVEGLRGLDYRCEVMCEAAHWGGSCRCSELSNELPALTAKNTALQQRLDKMGAVLRQITSLSASKSEQGISRSYYDLFGQAQHVARAALAAVEEGQP